MAPHSSTLAWKIPWTEVPGRLQSMGSLRVGHDSVTSLPLFTFMHWRRKWQPTPLFLPGESQGWWSLVGCRLWGRTESDTTEATQQQQQQRQTKYVTQTSLLCPCKNIRSRLSALTQLRLAGQIPAECLFMLSSGLGSPAACELTSSSLE